MKKAPPSGSAVSVAPPSFASTCCVRSAIRAECSVGSASASSKPFVCRLCAPPQTAESAWIATRTMLFSGCCAVRVEPPVWAWKRSASAFGFVAPKRSRISVAHSRRAARNFATSWKKWLCALKKKERRAPNSSGERPGFDRRCAVGDPVRERERELLNRGRAGLADVVAGDRDRVPARDPLRAVGEEVRRQPHRRPRREDVVPARDVLLEDVVLDGAAERLPRHALLLGDELVEQEEERGRRVDRHRGRDLAERDRVEEDPHVGERVDRDARAPDLAERHADRPSRSRAGSGGRTRPRVPSGRARAGSGSVRSSPRRTRSPRTAGSSRACPGTCPDRARGCTGTRRAARPRRRPAAARSPSRSRACRCSPQSGC